MYGESVFTGGEIRTIDPDRPVVEAVLVQGGRIAMVGATDDVRAAAPNASVHDLGGACLLPGFVDAHTHPLMLGQCSSWADLTGVSDAATLVDRMRRHATTVAPGRAIRGFGYDQHLFPAGRHPHADDLDRVAGDREVVIMHASGHGYVANHFALHEAGITSDTPIQSGGLIGRDASGHLDGRVFDAACDLLTGPAGVKITNHGPNLHLGDDPDALRLNLLDAQQTLLAAGITSVGDAQVTDRELGNYQYTRNAGGWHLRVSMYVLSSHLPALETLGIRAGFGDDTLRIGGVKCYADGSLISGTAYIACGCGGGHDFDGHLYHQFDELADLIERAHRIGMPTMTHAQGTVPIGVVLDAIEDAQRRHPGPAMRHRIDHCGLPTDEQIERMRRLDVWPVPQPSQVWRYGAGIRREIGEIAERMYPSGRFERAGVPVVLSSDTPVTRPDVLRALWAAVTRQTIDGGVLGPECAVSVETALAGYTIRGAEVLHREAQVGSIEVGKLADFAIVDRDPLSVPLEDLPTIQVLATIIGGSTVWNRCDDGSGQPQKPT
jgi:predicted amidohydrolase YtcJ